MASPKPKVFSSEANAREYVRKVFAKKRFNLRCIGAVSDDHWLVGTHMQLRKRVPLSGITTYTNPNVTKSRTLAEQKSLYDYWRTTGSISETALVHECSESTVYRIISVFTKKDKK